MQTIAFARDTSAMVAPPQAFPVAEGLTAELSSFIGRYPAVRQAFLVQFTYLPGYDPAVGDAPCLTCVVQLDGESSNDIFNEISRASQPIVDGRLGPWRFLDFFRYNDSVATAIEGAAAPFYVRKA